MPVDVLMPQMGESIAEGTIVRWMKKVGDTVDRDEPLFEISTDKVDAEIPSPAAGVLAEIRAQEGDTVPVNSIVAVIGSAVDVAAAPPGAQPTESGTPTPAAVPSAAPTPTRPETRAGDAGAAAPGTPSAFPAAGAASGTPGGPTSQPAPPAQPSALPKSDEDLLRERSSPLVRKIAQEHHVDLARIRGTGTGGRVTKHDILDYLGQEDRVEKMSVMRKAIAEHMVFSRRTSAHVHSVFQVDFARIAEVREAGKAEYERAGTKLTYLSFIIKAVADALPAVPVVNASIDGENIVYHKEVNIGIAVALDWGLIVPVIRRANERDLLGLSRAVSDLAGRARSKQLKPDEVTGGTFTITNPGVFGSLFGMPIINQPQVAILAVGAIEKRPVVVGDAVAVRPTAYLSLGYDHRIVDGAVADEFMSKVKHALERWDPKAA